MSLAVIRLWSWIVAPLLLTSFMAGRSHSAERASDGILTPLTYCSAPADALEEAAARLEKVDGVNAERLPTKNGNPFESRRAIAVRFRNWNDLPMTLHVVPALPGDRDGQPPEDYRGALVAEVIASDSRYTMVAPSGYDPEIADRVAAALGLLRSKEGEVRRLRESAAMWLDLRLAVARDSDLKSDAPQPLADGPTLAQIENFTRVFGEAGYNGGRRRGDPYLWFPVLECSDVSTVLATTADRGTRFVLLSDKLDEVLLSGSKRPRPWFLKRARAVRNAQGRPAVELVFDDVASARLARLINANPGRALALLLDNRVVQIQRIDGKWNDTLVVSGRAFDEKLVAGMVRSLRECMYEQIAVAGTDSQAAPADDDARAVELKTVEEALKPVLQKVEPKVRMEYRDTSLIVTHLPQTFKIHGSSKSGQINEQAHDEVGPSYKGFLLRVHLQPGGEVNQAVTPQTVRNPYWLTDLDVTPLAGTDKQIYWALSYGSRADTELLEKICATLKALGDTPAKK